MLAREKDVCLIAQITDSMLFALISLDFPIMEGARAIRCDCCRDHIGRGTTTYAAVTEQGTIVFSA